MSKIDELEVTLNINDEKIVRKAIICDLIQHRDYGAIQLIREASIIENYIATGSIEPTPTAEVDAEGNFYYVTRPDPAYRNDKRVGNLVVNVSGEVDAKHLATALKDAISRGDEE